MFPGRLQTKYFDIRYRQHPEQIAELGRFADAYIELVNRDFFYAEFRYPIRILVLENQRTLDNFLRVQFHEAPALGIYLPNYGVLATHENAGLGTLAHEIMHPLVEANLRDRPMWSFEGIPSFFEKFYGFWSKNELAIEWGYQNPWRVSELGNRLPYLDLKQIVSNVQPEGDESAQRLVSIFLWQKGKFKKFLQLIQARNKNGFDTYFEAAMDMPLDQIVPIWQLYLKSVAFNKNEIITLPVSTVFATEPEFRQFKNTHKQSID